MARAAVRLNPVLNAYVTITAENALAQAQTNLRLQPFDQIHVGETRQARVERCIPPWLRPVYQALMDTQPKSRGQGAGVRGQQEPHGTPATALANSPRVSSPDP